MSSNAPAADPAEAAQDAGLVYTSDSEPGIRRVRKGRGFAYSGIDGRPLRDPATLERIRSLAIPPAWSVVIVAGSHAAEVQAWGLDANGRKQYR